MEKDIESMQFVLTF